ncbi:hypothetical protein CBA19CS22_13315 [Caballeronia novacaledonica]|uniref:Uncharacterized protein n=1 Tax=Caballeronia novacaledonica TaxID=1544861 RepID=A0ACB5QS53_9BURK|nr:hypothetical protein CBA19CS22_13315 [Caballeronia novacaledonica]
MSDISSLTLSQKLMKRNHRAERRVHTIQRSQAPAHIAVLDINGSTSPRCCEICRYA